MPTMVRLRRCLLAAACLGAIPAAQAASDAKPAVPPDGYWIVATSEGDAGLVGGAFHFRKDGWDFFAAKGDVKRVDSRWTRDGHGWAEDVPAKGRLSLEQREKELALSFGGGRAKARLQPAPAARAAQLARALAAVPAPEEACRRAEACCKKGMPLLGSTCDVADQLGDRSTSTCMNTVKGMQMLLTEKKIPLPFECK
ncbi:MAG TPA: hypothetical protein VN903_33160 [Polyangia bacterium]|jgi:hypothetical protein|nr:hypothetical protein [Polyangia bacterium]